MDRKPAIKVCPAGFDPSTFMRDENTLSHAAIVRFGCGRVGIAGSKISRKNHIYLPQQQQNNCAD
jgi:hypothetical protein